MYDQNTEKLLTQINDRLNAPQYAGWLLFGGVALSIGVSLVNIWLALPMTLLGSVVVHFARRADTKRRTFIMPYTTADMSNRQWKAVTDSLSALAESQKLWLIHGVQSTWDQKRNAGATQLLNRSDVSARKAAPPFIETNVTPLCLNLGLQQLYFLPDRVYVYRPRKYEAVSYDTIKMESGITDFIETGLLPGDAQQIGQTWRYVNKDGSPDRRFSHNRPVPIARYGVFKITLRSDLSFTLHVSQAQAAKAAVAKFQQDTTTSKQNTGSQERSQQRRTSSSSHQRQQAPPPPPRPPKSEPVPDCYTILDLSRSCTQEEASAAYRKLAKQYHPDMVSHLAPEFQRMAEEKMKEFNKAYTELKRLRGW